jgi:hypothetical protein
LGLVSPSCRLYELEAGHTTPLDPMAGFEKIIRHKSRFQRDNAPEAHKSARGVQVLLIIFRYYTLRIFSSVI